MSKVAASQVRVTTFKRVAKSHERVVVRHEGKDCAVIVPLDDLALIRRIEDEIDLAAAKRALAQTKRGRKLIPLETLKRDLGL